MQWKRIVTIALAALCLAAGLLLSYRVLGQFRENLIVQHEEKMTDIVASVDRSARGYFELYYDSLNYVTGRRGFLEAESTFRTTGDTADLAFRMEENLLVQDLQVRTLLAICDGEVLLSTDGDTDYRLPADPADLFLCQSIDGAWHLAFLHRHENIAYAAVLDMEDFGTYLADSSAVNEADRLLLMEDGGEVFICHHGNDTHVEVITPDALSASPARRFTFDALGTDTQDVGIFEIEGAGGTSTMGYALMGDGASANGVFSICVITAYDAHLEVLRRDTAAMVLSFIVILAGLGLLGYYITALSRENRTAARELAQMKERHDALEKINEQAQKLAHHQRLETIGTLTSSISHEFNNLLTPIMSYSLLTLEKLPAEEEELYDNVLEIYNASHKAKEIISRLSDLSRKNSEKTFREVSLDELVKKALSIALPAKGEGVEVKLNLNCWDLPIRANEIQLCQMLLNLILNAFQAMPAGGTLAIDTTFDDDSVALTIADSGCGIDQEVLGKIFDPFFTTKDSGKGTGLGLAIVAQVVEDHAGTIAVRSAVGEGTAFTVTLPRLREGE